MSAKPKGWHKEDIKAAIRKRGVTLEQLSLGNGLIRPACSLALIRPTAAAEAVIAKLLGVPPQQIWPQRYNADGTSRHPSRRKYTRRSGGGKRQNGGTA